MTTSPDLWQQAHQLVADALDLASQWLAHTRPTPPDPDGSSSSGGCSDVDIDRARAQLDDLQQASRVLDQQLLDRQLAHIDLDARSSELERLAADLDDAVRRARADLLVRTDELTELARTVASADEHLRTLNLKIVDGQQTLNDLHHDLAEARARIVEQRTILENLRERVAAQAGTALTYQAQADQTRRELSDTLHQLQQLAGQVDELTSHVEHHEIASDAVTNLATVVTQLTDTTDTIRQVTDGLTANIVPPDPPDDIPTGIDDLMLHLYTTVAAKLDDIHRSVSAVLDLNDRLTRIASDPDVAPDLTGGRVDTRDVFLEGLRERADALREQLPAGLFTPLNHPADDPDDDPADDDAADPAVAPTREVRNPTSQRR